MTPLITDVHAVLSTTPARWQHLARARQDSLALLERLSAADLHRTARHPAFGTVTLAELVATWAAHDLNHTVQAERALLQPFLDGCGPWRSFFGDHEVAGPE